MPGPNSGKPMFWPEDPPELKEQLRQLVDLNYRVKRMTKYHIKIGEVNYFTTGTITIDPDTRHKDKGFEALIELLELRYSRKNILILDVGKRS